MSETFMSFFTGKKDRDVYNRRCTWASCLMKVIPEHRDSVRRDLCLTINVPLLWSGDWHFHIPRPIGIWKMSLKRLERFKLLMEEIKLFAGQVGIDK